MKFHHVDGLNEMIECIEGDTGHHLSSPRAHEVLLAGNAHSIPLNCDHCTVHYTVYVFEKFYYLIKQDEDSAMQIGVYSVDDKSIDMVKKEPYCLRLTSMF